MASTLVRDLIDAGVHFGHRANRWNPKMAPYIVGKRNSIHIIDIRETVKGLLRAKKFLTAIVSRGQDVLIVGTKRQARDSVEKQAVRLGMPFVTERWLGGTLTNFKTIRSRLARLEEIEEIVKTGRIKEYSKKQQSVLERERRKISRNLSGIRKMTRLPGALLIVDVRREQIAVHEARKLGIPTICMVDTDSNPASADILIPCNDDAMRAIEMILASLAEAIELGKHSRPAPGEDGADSEGEIRQAAARRKRGMTTSELAAHELDKETPPADGKAAEEPSKTPVEAVAAQASAVTTDAVQPGAVEGLKTAPTEAATTAAPATTTAPVTAPAPVTGVGGGETAAT